MQLFGWAKILLCFHSILIVHSMQNIIDGLKSYYQVVIFTNYEKKTDSGLDYFYQKILSRFSAVTIDLSRMELSGDNRTLKIKSFINPRKSSIYIILQGDKTDKTMKTIDLLNKLVTISPIKMRPRCLVVFLDHFNHSQTETKKILRAAWPLKFLDFSILKIYNHCNHIEYVNYNPFTKKFNTGCLGNKKDLFPEKLANANEYPLKLPVFMAPPYLTLEIYNNTAVNVDGNTPFLYLKIIAEVLNFKLKFTLIKLQSYPQVISDTIALFEHDEVNVTAIAYPFNDQILQSDILWENILEITKDVVIVPILLDYNVDIPLSAFIYLVSFFIITLIFVILFRIFKIQLDRWDFVNVIQILLGVSISQPTKNIDRIIFLSLVILSIIYSDDLFTQLTDIKVLRKEKEFNTFEDILNSSIPVYAVYRANRFESEVIKKVIFKSRSSISLTACFEEIIFTGNAICITPSRTAIYAIKNNLDAQGKSVMKMTDLSLNHQFVGFLYEKASPFVEKFDKMMQIMVESAIIPDREFYKVKFYELDKSKNKTDETISKTTLVILIIGYILSLITFVLEVIWSVTGKKRIRNRKKYARKKNIRHTRKKGPLVKVNQREGSVVYEIIDYYHIKTESLYIKLYFLNKFNFLKNVC